MKISVALALPHYLSTVKKTQGKVQVKAYQVRISDIRFIISAFYTGDYKFKNKNHKTRQYPTEQSH